MHPQSTQLDLDIYRQQADLAWAAGLFEGEGSISVNPSDRRGHIVVAMQLTMRDEDVVRHFHHVVGVGMVYSYRTKHRQNKPIYKWCLRGRKALLLLPQLLPWFGQRRTARAQEALEWADQIPLHNRDKTHCARGHPFTPENIYVTHRGNGRLGRLCRICCKERYQRQKMRLESEKP